MSTPGSIPVSVKALSMYDYALSQAEEENERLKAEVERLKNRLEQVFP